jgi:DHA2 family multidrug resistance protein-like MFS transporter
MTMSPDDGPDDMTQRPRVRSPWLGLAVLALPTLLLSVDSTVLYLALPSITRALQASPVEQLWILDIYSFVLAGFLVPMGSLGDRIGHRRLMLIGAAAFGVVSVGAAFATSPLMLIVARAVLGVAGATLGPTTLALIRTLFPDEQQFGRAIGLWFACFTGGTLVGPLIGGVVLETTWWGGIFLLGVPVMTLLLVLGPVLLPSRPESAGRRPVDLASTAIALGTVLPTIWGIKELARGSVSLPAFLAIAVGLAAGVVFVRRQLRLPEPMLDLRLFAVPTVGYGLGANLLTGVVMAGSSLLASFYLQTVAGLSPLQAAWWLVPQTVAMIIGFQVAPLARWRLPQLVVVAIGFGLAGAGLGLLGTVTPGSGPVLVAGALTAASFGIAGPMTVLQTLIMTAAPPEQAGSAAGANETSGEFGIALGIALLGSLAGAVTGRALANGSAPGPAFTAGYAVAEGVAAAVFVALAVAALLIFRRGHGTPSDRSKAAMATETAA